MIRCPNCGVRLSDTLPRCRVHGEPALPAQPEDADFAHSAVHEVASGFVETELRTALLAAGYSVIGRLGEGGFGTVLAVERLADKRAMALKLTRDTGAAARAELALEVDATRKAGDDVAPHVYAHGELTLPSTGAHGYVVMAHVAATTLADLLVAAAPFPIDTFTRVSAGLVLALSQLHARGVVHRDLKPENIFVGADGKVTLIDFGLARTRGAASQSADGKNRDVGTAEYMSPEQCVGDDAGDVRTDIYSLGIILYEALAGAPPFWGTAADVREQHQSRRPQPLTRKGTLAGVDTVVRACLAKRPGERFESVDALGHALAEALSARRGSLRPAQDASAEEGTPKAREGGREKRRVGLLFFTSVSPVMDVQAAVVAAGGQLVQHTGNAVVAAFGHDAADHPVQLAFNAALTLRSRRLSERLLVDVGEVSMQRRPNGATRFFGAVLNDKSRIPGPQDPHGVTFTAAASDTLPDARFTAVPGRADRFVVSQREAEDEATTFGLERPSLVGRDAELAQLMALAERAIDETLPTLATVVSEAGYGKSHLSRELALTLLRRANAPEVIRVTVREGIAGAPSQAFPQLLRRVVGLEDDASPELVRERLSARLPPAERERGLAAALFVLGAVGLDDPEVKRLAAAPSALRLAAARVLGEVLRATAQQHPLVLIVDDAHLSDEATLDGLEYATMAEGNARLFVCVCVRPSFANARPVWSARAARSGSVTLPALDVQGATELARRLLLPVEFVPLQALARLVERTQGVPRLMVELVRGLKRDGIVRRVERGTAYFLATDELDRLPDLPIVQWNAQREVEALPSELQAHAKLCALLGGRFGLPEVEGMLEAIEREDPSVDVQLDAQVGVLRLARAGLLVRHRDGELAFRHSLLRDTVYGLLSEAERKRWHRVALHVYRASKLAEEYVLPRLALHAASSGEHETAAQAYLTLGRRALLAHSYLEAEAAFGAALTQLTEIKDARSVEAARCRGLMRSRLGRHDDALRDLRRARELAAEANLTELGLDILLDEAIVLDWLRQFAASEACVREVEAAAPAENTLLYVRLLAGLARAAHRRSDSETCVSIGLRAANLALAFGDAGYETRLITLLVVAPDCAYLGRLEQAAQYFAEAIADAEAHSDAIHAAVVLLNRATLWYSARNGEALASDLLRGITLAREVGEPLMEYSALNNMGETKFALEELEEARDYTERGRTLARRLWGDASREVFCEELLLARIAVYAGDLDAAADGVSRAKTWVAQQAGATSPNDLTPAELLTLRMLELALDGPQALASWEALVTEAMAADMSPQEQLEVIEARVGWAMRLELRDHVPGFAQLAVDTARERPNLLGERVLRRLAPLLPPAA